MTVKNWLLTSLILMIPIVNLVMLFVWAFGDSANKNKANYAKASLLMILIVFVFSLFAKEFMNNTTF